MAKPPFGENLLKESNMANNNNDTVFDKYFKRSKYGGMTFPRMLEKFLEYEDVPGYEEIDGELKQKEYSEAMKEFRKRSYLGLSPWTEAITREQQGIPPLVPLDDPRSSRVNRLHQSEFYEDYFPDWMQKSEEKADTQMNILIQMNDLYNLLKSGNASSGKIRRNGNNAERLQSPPKMQPMEEGEGIMALLQRFLPGGKTGYK